MKIEFAPARKQSASPSVNGYAFWMDRQIGKQHEHAEPIFDSLTHFR